MNRECHLDIKNYKLKIFRMTSYNFKNKQYKYSEYIKEQKYPGTASNTFESKFCEIEIPMFEKDEKTILASSIKAQPLEV